MDGLEVEAGLVTPNAPAVTASAATAAATLCLRPTRDGLGETGGLALDLSSLNRREAGADKRVVLIMYLLGAEGGRDERFARCDF